MIEILELISTAPIELQTLLLAGVVFILWEVLRSKKDK